MTSVGKLLRSAREEQKRTIAEIAEELCITQRYLRALEEDDLASLPGVFFYRSFVRQYAALLGVDPKKVQPAIDEVATPPEMAPPVAPPPPRSFLAPAPAVREPDPLVQDFNRYLSDRRIGVSIAALAVALLACSAFYAWWTKNPEPVAIAVSPELTASQPVVRASVSVPTESITIPTSPDSQGMPHADLVISATETTWLSVTSDGKVIFSGVLEPSQTKSLTGVDAAQMKVGNAGGLDVRWKGKAIGPVGPRGQVRTVLFKTDDVEILQPPPENSEL